MSQYQRQASQTKAKSTFLQWVGPITVFVVVMTSWQLIVSFWNISKFILPGPYDIWLATVENRDRLFSASIRTAVESFFGFGLSLVLGFLFSAVLSQSKWIRKSLLPYALIFQTVPIIGVAPLLITWFGNTFTSVVLISTFISIFPIINNTTTGLTRLEKGHWELFELYRANRWQFFWKLQVPSCLPYAVAGAKIAAAACVLGASVGDMFVGVSDDQEGLGYVIFQAKDRSNSLMFATLATLTIMGISFYSITSWISENLILGSRHKKESGR